MFNIRKASKEINNVARLFAKEELGDERLGFEVKAKCNLYDEITGCGCSKMDFDELQDEEISLRLQKNTINWEDYFKQYAITDYKQRYSIIDEKDIAVLKYLDNIVNFEIPQELSTIKKERNTSNCIGCGTCCKFACSEFSYSELKNKAQAGDNYAKQFVSVFIPYSSNEDVEKIFPEYYDLLKNSGETEYYFYHCPKITKNNQCPDYDNRPQICRDFPDNPIAFLPLKCGFNNWKLKSERVLLKLNAIAEIAEFYKNNIKGK